MSMSPEEALAEARRRVAEAKETRADILDLGDLPLHELPDFGDLPHLRVLALGKYCPKRTGDDLTWEFNRNRPGFQGEDLGPLSGVTQLTRLNLSGCVSIADASPLSRLEQLTHLDLSWCKSIAHLSPLSDLKRLSSLDLSWCKSIADVSPLSRLEQLTELDLSWCTGLRELAPLRRLRTSLELLWVNGCTFDDLQKEVCGEFGDNVIEAVRTHYDDLEKSGAEDTLEVKAFVLGNGGVGKTQMCRRLRDKPYDPDPERVPTTHGVQFGDYDLTLDGRKVRLNLWDFGGQEIYHGTHGLFVGGPGVFLLPWHPEMETGFCEEAGLTLRHHPLSYWLDYVRGLAGTQMPVLVIQSQCESPDGKCPLPVPLPADFRYVRELQFAAAVDWALPELRGCIKTAVHDLLLQHPAPEIAANRARVRDALRAELEKPVTERRRTLTPDEFHAVCENHGGVASEAELLKYLHNCGVVFYKPELFQNRIIVDQAWALDAIYSLFHRRADLQDALRFSNGRFTRAMVARVWEKGNPPFTPGEQRLFLDMMESCGVCFRVRNRGDSENPDWEYRAPEWFPEWAEVERHVTGPLPKARPGAKQVARYAFLHDGILRTFLSRIGSRAGDHATYWKYGCWFYDEETRSQVMIESRQGGDSAHPGRGEIEFRAWGNHQDAEPRALVNTLLAVLQQIPVGQPPEVPEPRAPRQRGRPRAVGREGEPRANPLSILRPGRDPNRPPRVAISYGHGDDTEAGRIRGAFVDDLEPVIRDKWKYAVLRDVNELKNLESIRQFVYTIAESDRVVVVLSRKYLESVICMTELYAIYMGVHGRWDHFFDCIVPCVLADAFDIFTDDGRERWRSHWDSALQRRDALKSLGQLGKDYSKQIQHFTLEIGDMLETIANAAMECRGVEALRADEFAAVKKMLERPRLPG